MKRSKFFFGAGTLLLAVAGVLAGRASTKSTVAHVFFTTGVSPNKHCAEASGLINNNNFTTGGTGQQATIKTSGGVNKVALWGTSKCSTDAVSVQFHL